MAVNIDSIDARWSQALVLQPDIPSFEEFLDALQAFTEVRHREIPPAQDVGAAATVDRISLQKGFHASKRATVVEAMGGFALGYGADAQEAAEVVLQESLAFRLTRYPFLGLEELF